VALATKALEFVDVIAMGPKVSPTSASVREVTLPVLFVIL